MIVSERGLGQPISFLVLETKDEDETYWKEQRRESFHICKNTIDFFLELLVGDSFDKRLTVGAYMYRRYAKWCCRSDGHGFCHQRRRDEVMYLRFLVVDLRAGVFENPCKTRSFTRFFSRCICETDRFETGIVN